MNRNAVIYTIYLYFLFSLIASLVTLVFIKSTNFWDMMNDNSFAENLVNEKNNIYSLLEDSLNSITHIQTDNQNVNITIQSSLNPNINISENLMQTEKFINMYKDFYGANININFSLLKNELNNVTRIIEPQKVFIIHDYDNKIIYLNNTSQLKGTYIFIDHNVTTFSTQWIPTPSGDYPVVIKTPDSETSVNLTRTSSYVYTIRLRQGFVSERIRIFFNLDVGEILVDYSDLSVITNVTIYFKNELSAGQTLIDFNQKNIVNLSLGNYETSI